jgi:cold shock CspA family protein
MAYGTVKWLDEQKNYGIIEHRDGESVFLHRSEIKSEGENKLIRKGDQVAFDVISYEMIDAAVNIVLL